MNAKEAKALAESALSEVLRAELRLQEEKARQAREAAEATRKALEHYSRTVEYGLALERIKKIAAQGKFATRFEVSKEGQTIVAEMLRKDGYRVEPETYYHHNGTNDHAPYCYVAISW